MFDQNLPFMKEFITFQLAVFKAFAMIDGLNNLLVKKGLISKEELDETQKAALETDYVKAKIAECDKAIKEIEEYEKMDLGDMFSSLFNQQGKEKSDKEVSQ